MKLLFIIVLILQSLLMTGCQTTPFSEPIEMGMTKKQVVAKLGFPVSSYLNTGASQGAPGYESWIYYQKTKDGNIEAKDIHFGNSNATLGRVVCFATGLEPKKMLRTEEPDDLTILLQYERR